MNKHRIFIVILSVLSGVCFGVALSTQLLVSGAFGKTYRAYIVQSGSMEPALPVGAIVLTQTSPDYNVGDIITFETTGNTLVTHRVFSVSKEDGGTIYQTKGDANEEADNAKVSADKIIGKAFWNVPRVGYFADFVRTPKGFVAFVIIPASIIVYEELKALFREIKNAIFGQKADGKTLKTAAFVPILGSMLLLISSSGSFYLDSEDSRENGLTAAAEFPTPQPSADTPTLTPIP